MIILRRCFEKANLGGGRINYIFYDLLTLFFLRSLLFSHFFSRRCLPLFFRFTRLIVDVSRVFSKQGFTLGVCLPKNIFRKKKKNRFFYFHVVAGYCYKVKNMEMLMEMKFSSSWCYKEVINFACKNAVFSGNFQPAKNFIDLGVTAEADNYF